MGDVLQQIGWKLRRAREKSEEADRLCEAWMQKDGYTVRYEQDRQGRLVVRIGEVKDPPPDYPLLIGEIAHHLRSALDHIVFALAKPRTAREEERIKFPVCSTRKVFNSQKTASLRGVPRGVLTIVEAVQPYHRRKWPDTRLLGQLQAIDNWSKHRAIPIATASIETSEFAIKIEGNTSVTFQESYRGLIKPNKIITRLSVGASEAGAKIYCNPTLGLMPVFDDAMPKQVAGCGVRTTLNRGSAFIAEVIIPCFEKFF